MIRVEHLSKTYVSANHSSPVKALDDVSLEVKAGSIFGVIGFSGAGKSSLIRCINRLEEPDHGKIYIGDTEITGLGKDGLRQARLKVGMIFQHFNLFDAKTVYENVAFPLEIAGVPKSKIRGLVEDILEIVGLSDKLESYPSQLSGGQKQRVGIARALVNKPDVLLCDEATSALDPQTTLSILELLKSLNGRFGVTILLITHELDVLRYICNDMAVIEAGRIVESGSVKSLFENPQSETGRRFVHIHESIRLQGDFEAGGGI